MVAVAKVGRAPFVRTLRAAARILPSPSQSPLPILQSFRLWVTEGRLYVGSSDLETSLVQTMEVEADGEWGVCVPAILFGGFVASLEGDSLSLTLEGGKLQVRGGAATAQFRTESADQYPLLPEAPEDGWECPAQTWRTALNRCLFAATNDEYRSNLTGLWVRVEDATLMAAGADGYRLGAARLSLLLPSGEAQEWRIPCPALRHLSGLLGKDDALVTIARQRNQVVWSVGGSVLSSRLIEGQYVDFARHIPATCTTVMTLSRAAFLTAVEQAALVSKSNNLAVALQVEADRLIVRGQSEDGDEAAIEIPAVVAARETERIAANGHYLREALTAIDSTEVCLGFNHSTSPLLLTPPGDRVGNQQVIMAMHLQGWS